MLLLPLGATLFYGARRGTELFCTDVFERLGVQLALATEDGSRGDTGVVTVPLERALARVPAAETSTSTRAGRRR